MKNSAESKPQRGLHEDIFFVYVLPIIRSGRLLVNAAEQLIGLQETYAPLIPRFSRLQPCRRMFQPELRTRFFRLEYRLSARQAHRWQCSQEFPGFPPRRTPTLTIGGIPAPVLFSGIAPGTAAEYQINTVIPPGVTPGDDVPVVLS